MQLPSARLLAIRQRLACCGWGLAAALPILIHLWSRRKYPRGVVGGDGVPAGGDAEERPADSARTVAAAGRAHGDPRAVRAGPGRSAVVAAVGLGRRQCRRADAHRAGARRLVSRWTIARTTNRGSTRPRSWPSRSSTRASRATATRCVLMGQPPRVVIGQPAFDPRGRAARRSTTCKLPHGGASLPATLAEVETILRQAEQNAAAADAAAESCFFTDLQQHDLGRSRLRPTAATGWPGWRSWRRCRWSTWASPASQPGGRPPARSSQPLVTSRGEVTLSGRDSELRRQDSPAAGGGVPGRWPADRRRAGRCAGRRADDRQHAASVRHARRARRSKCIWPTMPCRSTTAAG